MSQFRAALLSFRKLLRPIGVTGMWSAGGLVSDVAASY
jgi:hypothetical protein